MKTEFWWENLGVKKKKKNGRSGCSCEGNIKMYLKGTGWKVVNWIHLAQDRNW